MAKQMVKVPSQELKVGDLVCFSSSQAPSDRFHRITEVTRTAPYYPLPGASQACVILIRCGKRGPSIHMPEGQLITTKR